MALHLPSAMLSAYRLSQKKILVARPWVGSAMVRRACQVAGRGEALEFRDVVGGNAQGDAAGEDARVIPEGGKAGTSRTWVSKRGAISEVLGS